MRIKGVVCDLDGTLVDSEGAHMEAWNELIRHYGLTPPDSHWHDDCIGMPDSSTRDKLIRVFPELERRHDEIMDLKDRFFRELVQKMGRGLAYPGVHDRLSALRERGVRLAVGTNSIVLNCETSLRAAELTEFFPVIVTLDRVAENRGKPHPDIYLAAVDRLGLEPADCVVLEDSTAGLQAARAAGCVVAALTNTWPEEKLVPSDMIFPNTAAALDWILARQYDSGAHKIA